MVEYRRSGRFCFDEDFPKGWITAGCYRGAEGELVKWLDSKVQLVREQNTVKQGVSDAGFCAVQTAVDCFHLSVLTLISLLVLSHCILVDDY